MTHAQGYFIIAILAYIAMNTSKSKVDWVFWSAVAVLAGFAGLAS